MDRPPVSEKVNLAIRRTRIAVRSPRAELGPDPCRASRARTDRDQRFGVRASYGRAQ